jgi:hypothetical protein
MGFEDGMHRGHLIPSILGGSNTKRENFVPLNPQTNYALEHGAEKEVKDEVDAGYRVFYLARPLYHKGRSIPYQVDITWYSNSGRGWHWQPYTNSWP